MADLDIKIDWSGTILGPVFLPAGYVTYNVSTGTATKGYSLSLYTYTSGTGSVDNFVLLWNLTDKYEGAGWFMAVNERLTGDRMNGDVYCAHRSDQFNANGYCDQVMGYAQTTGYGGYLRLFK